MSFNTTAAAAADADLQARVIACVSIEAFNNPVFGGTPFGQRVQGNPFEGQRMVWPVAVDGQAAYASAVAAGNPRPGYDEAVITDAMILSAVQADWPMT